MCPKLCGSRRVWSRRCRELCRSGRLWSRCRRKLCRSGCCLRSRLCPELCRSGRLRPGVRSELCRSRSLPHRLQCRWPQRLPQRLPQQRLPQRLCEDVLLQGPPGQVLQGPQGQVLQGSQGQVLQVSLQQWLRWLQRRPELCRSDVLLRLISEECQQFMTTATQARFDATKHSGDHRHGSTVRMAGSLLPAI